MEALKKNIWVSYFSLFTSMSTLICCALPALLVSIGLGATMVGLVSTFPSLIWLSENKLLVFSASFLMLAISSYMQYRARFLPCPIDPEAARACTSARVWSRRITIFSIIVWLTGAAFAFLPLLLAMLEA
jgi:mercuric ion transport protein